ncbi:MAG: bacterial transcriptional activator domain-containing protein [Anaerolineae bacterium]|nr:bacterial transcriptional activator domain-containing protein [Anaerolineae bacterium]
MSLQVYALGEPQVFYKQTLLHFPTKKTEALFYYLVLSAGESLTREVIAEQFWPMRPAGKANHCLSTTLWRLRTMLKAQCPSTQPYLLTDSPPFMIFNRQADYWLDVEAFEQAAILGLQGPCPCSDEQCQALEKALTLYRADLLEGCYEDWCRSERERLQTFYIKVLRKLLHHHQCLEDFGTAIHYGQRLLALDVLQEDIYRDLMRCYAAVGQRPRALEIFQECCTLLRQECNIEPMPETYQLYRQIRAGESLKFGDPLPFKHHSALQTAITQTQRALETLEAVLRSLQVVE